MKLYTLLLAVTLAFFGPAAVAQPDTSKYDPGYLKLDKNFTQHITIRGADLEKMPFTNLSDAIAPWLYGAYTTPGTLLYVVDGNPVSDVNAYSVFDIEEVVLVQQAAGLVGAFGSQQQLVLIKTRRGKGKQGITAGAQTGLVNASSDGAKSDTRLYHQYYIGGYRNLSKISYGLSGDYQRDVFPFQKSKDPEVISSNPVTLQRWRLNGYFTWRPNAANQIEATMNYTPQHGDESVVSASNGYQLDFNSHIKQHLILPRLTWHSDILPGLKNDLQVAWLGSQYTENIQQLESMPQGNPTLIIDHTEIKGNSIRVNERLSYQFSAGGWKIEPAVNASYEHFYQKFTGTSSTAQNVTIPYNLASGTTIAYSSNYEEGKAKIYMLTPAVDITFNRALNINGGVFVDVDGVRFTGARKSSAFASVAVDLLQLGKAGSDNNLKLFGSYAQQTMLTGSSYALGDLTNGTVASPVVSPVTVAGSVGAVSNPTLLINPTFTVPSYWVWESGITWSTLQHRLELSYTLEQRRPSALAYQSLPFNGGYLGYYQQWHSTLHHFGVKAKILDGEMLSWESGLNVTLLKGKTDSNYYVVGGNFVKHYGKPGVGEFDGDPYSWTGGFVNRLRLGQFTAGLDLLYHFHETVYSIVNNSIYLPSRVNSFVTPNIYAGYDLHLPHGQGLELFAESRGLVRNHQQDLMDARKYYTIGGKFTIQ